MTLHITDKQCVIDDNFARWLVDQVRIQVITRLKVSKLEPWDKYFTESNTVVRMYDKSYRATDIVLEATKHLRYRFTSKGRLDIFIDNRVFVPGFDRLLLDVACRTINYGTQEIKGVPIFSEAFSYVAENIDEYARSYYPTV